MAAIEILVLVVVAGFVLAGIVTAVVIIGIHQEERQVTLGSRGAASRSSAMARRVLGARIDEQMVARVALAETLARNALTGEARVASR
jgi:hypothetical protein